MNNATNSAALRELVRAVAEYRRADEAWQGSPIMFRYRRWDERLEACAAVAAANVACGIGGGLSESCAAADEHVEAVRWGEVAA